MNNEQSLAQKIHAQYARKEKSDLDTLQALDKKVKRFPTVFSYIFGSLSALFMGSGMSLIMTDIGNMLGMADALLPGIIVGVLGLSAALITYPLYKFLLEKKKKKYANEIISLSEKMINH